MDKSVLDLSVDLIKEILGDIGTLVRDDVKNVKPYRQVKKSNADTIAEYMSMSPEVKQAMYQQMPDIMSNYESQMKELIGRYGNAGRETEIQI